MLSLLKDLRKAELAHSVSFHSCWMNHVCFAHISSNISRSCHFATISCVLEFQGVKLGSIDADTHALVSPELPPFRRMSAGHSQCVLKVQNLCRSVSDSDGGERQILTALSFAVTTSDILFVRGPSGVGKTLLLRSLALLDPVQV